jgi:hypothetical protein
MARLSRRCRLLAVAIVALLCSAFDAHAFALCDDCPDLFASTPIAQQAALPQRWLQRAPLHDRYASRWHQTRDDPLPHWLVFGAETVGSTASQPMDEAASSAATPALRIDAFFSLVSVGATDQPEQAAVLRTSVQGTAPYRPRLSKSKWPYRIPLTGAHRGWQQLVGRRRPDSRASYFHATPPTTRVARPYYASKRPGSSTDKGHER